MHALDKGHDSEELFEYIDKMGDYFVIRMKANRKIQQADTKAKMPLVRAEFEVEGKQTFIKIGYQDELSTFTK